MDNVAGKQLTILQFKWNKKTASLLSSEKIDCVIFIDHLSFWMFNKLMNSSDSYRQLVTNYWTNYLQNSTTLYLIKCPAIKPTVQLIDYTGCKLAFTCLWKIIEQDDALHWLSTLGGAFSNLGEANESFAQRAGHNAMKQLLLGSCMGDISVVAKCQLFLAHSEMQLGRMKSATMLVRRVWSSCKRPPLSNLAITEKLEKMCLGIWSRLRYERKRNRPKNQEIELKFVVPKNYSSILIENGASLINEKMLEDVYFDTNDFQLLKKDVWLRKRGDDYELKIAPYNEAHIKETKGMTHYHEVAGINNVTNELSKVIKTRIEDLDVLVNVSAKRQNWELEDFKIVIDEIVDDGWMVGEVELMAGDNDNVIIIKQRIEELTKKLNFKHQPYGKVRHCLKTQNEKAYDTLCKL